LSGVRLDLDEAQALHFVFDGWTRGTPRRTQPEADAEPDEYELEYADHGDEEDWADY
jgi:hypothetical protein